MQSHFVFTDEKFSYCHAPTVVASAQGLIMACVAGPAEGHPLTKIWSASFDGTWQDHHPVVEASAIDGRIIPLWNPVLFRASDRIRLFFRTGTSPDNWTCGYVDKLATDDWTTVTQLENYLTGPVRNKPIQLKSGNIITPTSTELDRWDIHFELFHQDRSKWEIISVPNSNVPAIQPVIIAHDNDTLQALCRTRRSFIAQTWSYDNGLSWSELELTKLSNPNAAIDAFKYGDLGYLLVYNNSQFGRYQLEIACSSDGIDWEDKLTLENTLGEYSYPSITLSQDGSLHILYTHNRSNIKHIELTRQEVTQLFEAAT